jgi:hypothetical protein
MGQLEGFHMALADEVLGVWMNLGVTDGCIDRPPRREGEYSFFCDVCL